MILQRYDHFMHISIPPLLKFLWCSMHAKSYCHNQTLYICKCLIVSVFYDLYPIQFHKIIYINDVRYYLLFILIKLKIKQEKLCRSWNFVKTSEIGLFCSDNYSSCLGLTRFNVLPVYIPKWNICYRNNFSDS